jgi:hypothetical protein
MGLLSPTLPDTNLAEWRKKPYLERLRMQALHWAENGYGTPSAVYLFYLVKMAAFVIVPALIIWASTPGLGAFRQIGSWWIEPIVYQKFVIFAILFEVLGFGCGSGPLTGRFFPPLGGFTYWLRPGTLRLPPWPKVVPLTRGDQRSVVDVLLYAAVIGSLGSGFLAAPVPGGVGHAGLLNPVVVIVIAGALVVLGLRDKTIFLAARADQYWWMLIAFLFPFADMIISLKLIMIAVWWGAATSKLNHHFPFVTSVMLANSPVIPRRVKRRLFINFPDDIRPAALAKYAAHLGTVVEFTLPLLLLLSTNSTLTLLALAGMTLFHLFIMSTIPAGVPLEWNIFVIISAWFLFGNYGATTYSVFSPPSPLIATLFVPIVALIAIGNLKPEWISFLFGMRYYAGNWATGVWLMRPGVEAILDEKITKSAGMTKNQLRRLYDDDTSEFLLQKFVAWRSMHAHGRAHVGLIPRAVDDADSYVIREAEFLCGALIGWNFGEGHLHDEQLIEALQKRCDFADGDLRVIFVEGQPVHKQEQRYRIVDAASGLIEEGIVRVSDLVTRQPWLDSTGAIPAHPTRGGPAGSAEGTRPGGDADR